MPTLFKRENWNNSFYFSSGVRSSDFLNGPLKMYFKHTNVKIKTNLKNYSHWYPRADCIFNPQTKMLFLFVLAVVKNKFSYFFFYIRLNKHIVNEILKSRLDQLPSPLSYPSFPLLSENHEWRGEKCKIQFLLKYTNFYAYILLLFVTGKMLKSDNSTHSQSLPAPKKYRRAQENHLKHYQ